MNKAPVLLLNYYVRHFLTALEDVGGKADTAVLLNRAGLAAHVERYPPEDWERTLGIVDFADLNTVCEQAGVEHMVARRAGYRMAVEYIRGVGGWIAMLDDPTCKMLPPMVKIKVSLPRLVYDLSLVHSADAIARAHEHDDRFTMTDELCPFCVGRETRFFCHSSQWHDRPVCYGVVGMLEGALYRITRGLRFHVVETQYRVLGHSHCEFTIFKEPI